MTKGEGIGTNDKQNTGPLKALDILAQNEAEKKAEQSETPATSVSSEKPGTKKPTTEEKGVEPGATKIC